MQVYYTLTADDMVVLTEWHNRPSTWKKTKEVFSNILAAAIITIAFGAFLLQAYRGSGAFIEVMSIVALMVFILVVIIVPILFREYMRWRIRRVFQTEQFKEALKPMSIQISPEEFIHRQNDLEVRVPWSYVKKIDVQPSFIVITINETQTMIPRRAFQHMEEFQSFIDQLRSYQQKREHPYA